MKLTNILDGIDFTLLRGSLDAEVAGISTDNRKARPGDVFICIKGARFDTHSCVKQVADMGVSLIVVSRKWAAGNEDVTSGLSDSTALICTDDTRLAKARIAAAWYSHPAKKLFTIGVTGSKGKTTVTHMIASILNHAGIKTGTIGTNGVIIQDDFYELGNTTPDSEEMQMYLAKMADKGMDAAVIECSSQGLMQHRTGGFTFDIGIFTNIAEGDHVGPNEHRDFAEYLYCKSLLLRQSKLGIVNADDVHVPDLLKGVNTDLLFYGEAGNQHYSRLDYEAISVEKTFDGRDPGIRFYVRGVINGSISVSMPGEFNVLNALAAAAAATRAGEALSGAGSVKRGVSLADCQAALGSLSIKGRLDMVYRSDKFSVCVDFAHNGYSTRNLLKALREYRPVRLVCIFGADGNRAKSRRLEMGEACGRLADFSIVTSGHNRYETFEQIYADIYEGLKKTSGDYMVIPDRKEAIRYAVKNAQDGDLITIIGLGHETYQEENGVKYPYSDTEYVLKVIEEVNQEDGQ